MYIRIQIDYAQKYELGFILFNFYNDDFCIALLLIRLLSQDFFSCLKKLLIYKQYCLLLIILLFVLIIILSVNTVFS